MKRRRIVGLLALGLIACACSARSPGEPPAASATPTTQGALDGCVPAGQATLVDLGGGHQAAVLGSGGSGVVLSNQSDQDLCGWLPFGKALAGRGFRVLLYDYGATADPAGDVALAATKLRSLGAGTVQLVGASEGAKASLIAATSLQPPPAAVVSLSAERTLRGTDVLPAAAKLRVPALFVTARDDSLVGQATAQLYQAAGRSPSRRLEVVAGDAHGTALLTGTAGAKLQGTLVDFLRLHGGGAGGATTTAAAASAVSDRCGPPEAAASLIHFRATDGTRLDGALVGSGRAGVVLLHQYPNDLCGFWPYAVYLAGKGLRVLDIDLRCFGESSCPSDAKGTVVDDVAGAVAELKRRGAGSVALVGASAGASTALIAGARLGSRVSSVVSLSGERDLTLVMGVSGPPDAVPLVRRLTSRRCWWWPPTTASPPSTRRARCTRRPRRGTSTSRFSRGPTTAGTAGTCSPRPPAGRPGHPWPPRSPPSSSRTRESRRRRPQLPSPVRADGRLRRPSRP
jgi:pimeloyl-ACP methyl ester carboxylesterase